MTHIRTLGAADIPLGMRLKEQAGWNQTEADWLRFRELEPEGCFVAEWDARAVGTATTCTFGPVAWVAMVLVDPAVRGRGIGTALLSRALVFLEGRGVRSIRLDATPLGRPLYEKLGFVPQYPLTRYQGILPPSTGPITGVEQVPGGGLAALVQLDERITGTDRRKLLLRLFAEQPEAIRVVREGGCVQGFLTARPGSRALQIGPCLATPEAGRLLFADAGYRWPGRRVFVDIPAGNRPAVVEVEGLGLTATRQLLRMCRGEPIQEQVAELWASSGPEKG